tara:strand:- start:374 stop:511 length:138 start_codon:yes stop_codon:yes gene_type:complete
MKKIVIRGWYCVNAVHTIFVLDFAKIVRKTWVNGLPIGEKQFSDI